MEAGSPDDRARVRVTMRHWQADADLAAVRDAEALATLPAEERTAFARLWADVAALAKAEERPK